jgi:predicted NBD/HSP70 family sugar kinase
MKLFEILFEGKRVWYGAENQVNPDYVADDGTKPRISSDVRATYDQRTFESIAGNEEKLEYLKKTAKYIDSGSSRIVFAISPKKVIKLIGGTDRDDRRTRSYYQPVGRAQNKAEYNAYERASSEVKTLLPKIYKVGNSFEWMLAELVRPLNSPDELRKLLKLDEKQFSSFMTALSFGGKTDHYQSFLSELNSNQRAYFDILADLIESFDLQAEDLTTVENWGKSADGRLVILDTGATKEVMKRFYGV